jgi:hypothetical protein
MATNLPAKLAAATQLPALVPQAHGGALLAGGLPGHRGGTGRPPSALRERMRGALEDRVHIAEEIADDPNVSPADRVRALDFLARYGLGTRTELVDDAPESLKVVVSYEGSRQYRIPCNPPHDP